ncbi:sensor domain-containing protein [Plantactinospora sp. GCM10030261]|uniref:sensor histidine kinase n=1 Tax=Plantactinospora sp. GCM10030261 TaxID=3273420 RepID=UPI00361C25A5
MPIDPPDHLLAALGRRRFPISAWPWRAALYVTTGVPPAAGCALVVLLAALPWLVVGRRLAAGTPPPLPLALFLGIASALVMVAGLALARPVARIERRRLRLVDRRPLGPPTDPRPVADRSLRSRLTDPATWREVAYAICLGTVVPAAYAVVAVLLVGELSLLAGPWLVGDGPVALGIATARTTGQAVPYAIAGLLLLALTPYLLGLLATGQAALARSLLYDDGETPALREVARSRDRLVDAYESERRRIERDLHDGAQHRVTSLALQLGMARLDVPAGSPAAEPLARAHDQAKELMVVLRDLVHGIRPQSLADLGLPGAVEDLARRSAIPVTVHSGGNWVGRLPERVENAAYFAVSEALANVARHSGADQAEVTLDRTGGTLAVEIRDAGAGGADPARGSGLTGLADRVAAESGRLLLSSPPGGPTVVRVELPCDR